MTKELEEKGQFFFTEELQFINVEGMIKNRKLPFGKQE